MDGRPFIFKHEIKQEILEIKQENLQPEREANGRIADTPFARRPPIVYKVDGRARILRPLRVVAMQPNQQPNQQPTTSTTTNGNSGAPVTSRPPSSGSIPHSQSMPVLQAGATRPSQSNQATPAPTGRPALTLPSNTTEKNVIPLLQWTDVMRQKLEKLRTKSQVAMEDSFKEDFSQEDLQKIRETLTDVANIYLEMSRAASIKCRLNTIFDKRGFYKSVESAIHDRRAHDIYAYQLYDQMQESMDEKCAIEKNILSLADTFRQNPVSQPRRSRFSTPPPVKFGKYFEEANKGLALAMDAVVNRTRGEMMTWKFKRISHRCFRNSKMLLEIQYCARRPSSDKEFVTCMKALLILKFGTLEDLIIGGEDETLWDPETIHTSKRKIYQEFTKSVKEIVLSSPVNKFTLPANIVQCNNYIQSYVNCFSTKCYYCKKHLRQFMPPTVVTREASPIICHKLCLMSQVP